MQQILLDPGRGPHEAPTAPTWVVQNPVNFYYSWAEVCVALRIFRGRLRREGGGLLLPSRLITRTGMSRLPIVDNRLCPFDKTTLAGALSKQQSISEGCR